MSDKEKGGDEGGSHHHKKKSKKGSKKGDKQKDGEKEVPATMTEKGDMHLGDLFNGYTIEKLGATDGSYMEQRFKKLPKNVFRADAFVTDKHLPDFPDVRELEYWAKEEAEVADKSEAYALGSSVQVDVSGNAGVNVTGVEVQGATLGGNLKLVGDYKSNHAARSWSVVHTKYHPKFKLAFQLDNLMKEKKAKHFLDSEFIEDVLALETDIKNEENFMGWVGFLKKWGTHIPLEAEIGGYLRASTTVNLRSKHREIGADVTGWLSAQVQQTLGVKIEGGVKPKVTRDSWEVQQQIDLHKVGGDNTIQFKPIMIDVTDISKALNLATEDIKANAEALKAWVDSLTRNLVVINMQFAAIETLFEWVLKGTKKQGKHEELVKTRAYFYPRVVVLYHGKDNHHALKFDHDHKGRFVTATIENDARPGYEFLFYEFKMREESCVTYCHLESGRFICADSHNVVRVADSRVAVGATFEKIQSEEGPDYIYLQTGTGKYLGFKAFILGLLESHKLTCIDEDQKEKHGQWRLRYLV